MYVRGDRESRGKGHSEQTNPISQRSALQIVVLKTRFSLEYAFVQLESNAYFFAYSFRCSRLVAKQNEQNHTGK